MLGRFADCEWRKENGTAPSFVHSAIQSALFVKCYLKPVVFFSINDHASFTKRHFLRFEIWLFIGVASSVARFRVDQQTVFTRRENCHSKNWFSVNFRVNLPLLLDSDSWTNELSDSTTSGEFTLKLIEDQSFESRYRAKCTEKTRYRTPMFVPQKQTQCGVRFRFSN